MDILKFCEMERVKNHGKNPVGRLGFLLLGIMFLNACTPAYQIAYVESEQVEKEGFHYVHGNDDVQLIYDFWGEGGVLDFDVVNRTGKLLFVHWDRSNYILNGSAYSFYSNEDRVNMVTSGYGPSGSEDGTLRDRSVHLNTSGKITRDSYSEQVPPQSKILSRSVPLDFPGVRLKFNETQSFTFDDSPLYIRTFISYSFTPEPAESDLRFIDNSFYVSESSQPNVVLLHDHRFPDRFYTPVIPTSANSASRTNSANGTPASSTDGLLFFGGIVVLFIIMAAVF
jgi:hypothetical protein